MASGLTFRIASVLDSAGFKQAGEALRGLTSDTSKNSSANQEHAGSVDVLKKAYGALVGLGIVEFYRASFEVAAQAREQELQLSQRVEQTGLSYEKVKPKLDSFFASLQAQSGIARDKLVPAFDFLVDRTRSVRTSQELMATTMGLARARGMDLAAAADEVAAVFGNQQRVMSLAGREIGLTTEQQKNNVLVLQKMKEHYAGLAVQTDTATLAQNQLNNSIKDAKIQIGEGLAAPLTSIVNIVKEVVVGFVAFGETVGLAMGTAVRAAEIGWDALKTTFTHGPRAAVKEANIALEALGNTFSTEFDQIAVKLEKGLNANAMAKIGDTLVDGTKKAFEKMNVEQLKALAEGNAAAAVSGRQQLDARVKLIEAETNVLLTNLRQQEEFRRLSAHDQQAIELSIQMKGQAAKAQAWKDFLQAEFALGMQISTELGTAMGRALGGQQDAWKDVLKNIIHMIAQTASAYVSAWAAGEFYKDIAAENYAGAAKAVAAGALGVAAIAALDAAATSGLGSGGTSSSVATAGMGGGGMAASAAASSSGTSMTTNPAGTTGGGRSQITINVQGDIVDSDSFMAALAARLSDKVENADIKLVASSVAA